ncbi:hypothetical protein JCM21900_000734 [Sporobolomyces salmonicolor]
MPRSPSPDRRSERSHPSASRHHAHRADPERERRRSRSPEPRRRRREEDDDRDRDRDRDRERERGGARRDKEKERERSRSRSRDRSDRPRRRRSRSRSRDEQHPHRSPRRRSRSRSRSVSSGSDSADSRDDGRRHRHRSSRDDDKDERRRRRKEKKERKAKREEKKRAKKGLPAVDWGRHGILTEADLYTKSDEFHAWLVSERMINPETLTKPKEKELFKQFMEDFNTSTLPHEKYYDMRKYEKKMEAVRMGETIEKDDSYDFTRDLEAAKAAHRGRAGPSDPNQLLDRERLEALRKVQNERVEMEKMKRLGLATRENMGVVFDMAMK